MNTLGDIPGIVYTDCMLPAVTADAATAIIGQALNPFEKSAYIDSITLNAAVQIANASNNTDTFNLNIQLLDGTEIANIDRKDNSAYVEVGTPFAFTISGNATQRLVAAGDGILVQREDSGTSPALVNGHIVRVGWRPRGS